MSRPLVIVNPAAGGGSCAKEAPDALEALRASGWEFDVVETRQPGDATDSAQEGYSRGVRTFVGVGGDGTSFEIINGFLPLSLPDDARPGLGFLPLGTGNSFLRDFSEHGAAHALNALREKRTQACDINQLDHEEGTLYSINICSMGFTAKVGAVTNRRFKFAGEKGYILGVLSTLANLKPDLYDLTVDGEELPEQPMTLLSLNNSQFTGGKMHIAPNASTSDGLCEVTAVSALSRMRLLRLFPAIFQGNHVHAPEVTTRKAREICFRSSRPMDVMVDGEVVRVTPQRLVVRPSALNVFV